MKARRRDLDPADAGAGCTGAQARTVAEDVRQLLRAERRRRGSRWFAGALVVLALGAVATLLVRIVVFEPVRGDPSAGEGTSPAANEGGGLLDPARPFDSTPAANWADGAAGIGLSAPETVGDFTAREVADATELVRDVLVASRLDQRMLVDHDPGRYLDMLAPDARRQLEPLFGSGREPEVQSLVSLVAPGTALLPVTPKVSGSMSVEEGDDAGELVVHTNYVFAYAFGASTPVRLVDVMNVVVVVRADVDYVLRKGGTWAQSSRGLWYDDATGFGYSIACDAYHKGFLAPVTTERSVHEQTGDIGPDEYFDPTAPLPPAGGCRH